MPTPSAKSCFIPGAQCQAWGAGGAIQHQKWGAGRGTEHTGPPHSPYLCPEGGALWDQRDVAVSDA